MNPGIEEEGGKVATGLIDSLKQQPLTLSMVVFNLVFIAAVYFGIREQRAQQQELLKVMLDNMAKTEQMLYQCIPPSKGGQLWRGEEDKQHSNALPSKTSKGTFVASVSPTGSLEGWYCTIPLHQPLINGGTEGRRPNKE